jgi:hypothetical protein
VDCGGRGTRVDRCSRKTRDPAAGGEYPHVAEVITHVMQAGRAEDFEFGLGLILDGLERILNLAEGSVQLSGNGTSSWGSKNGAAVPLTADDGQVAVGQAQGSP